jgi:hypothetical protein
MDLKDFQIVQDSAKNLQLFTDGYCQIGLLDKTEVDELRKTFSDHHLNESIEGLYVSSNVKPWDELMEISNKIGAIVSDKIDKQFHNIQKIGGTFIVKKQDDSNILHPHQDWNIVDEDYYRSFTVWIALQDTNDHNGAMYVLPTSHNWVRGYRHITIPSVYGKIYDLTWSYMKPIHLKAGEALVFDHALVHASKANQSPNLRIAATTTLLFEKASMRISCNNNGVVEEYECPPGFYIQPEAQIAPFKLPKVRNTNFKMIQLNEATFLDFAKKNKLRSRLTYSSLLKKIQGLFKNINISQ